MALLHFRPLGCPQGCPQGQHHSPHGTCLHAPASPGHSLSQTYMCLPREKALRWGTCNIANVGWEGNSGSRTVSLTLLLTHIWLWVLHCGTSVVSLQWGYTALCMPRGDNDGGRLFGDLYTKSFWGSNTPTEMTVLQPSKAPPRAPCMSPSLFTLRTSIPSSQEGADGLVLLQEGLFAVTLRSLKRLASFLRQHRIRWLIIKLTDFAWTLDTYGDIHQDSWGLCCVRTSAVFSNDH